MKKIYLFILLLASVATTANAVIIDKEGKLKKTEESSSGNGCFDENTHLINLGVGFGGGSHYKGVRGGAYTYRISPAISVNYEQAWKPKLGPGYLGIGAYIGYQRATYKYNYGYSNYYYNGNFYNGTGYYYQHSWNYYMIAARSAYHWDKLNSEKAEVYGGVLIGMRIQTYSYTTNDVSPYRGNYALNENRVSPAYSVFAGARWFFVPNVALFAEAGFGISYITGGVSFKF